MQTILPSEFKRLMVLMLETGLQIMVPLFIANGETIRVDTAGKNYGGREGAEE
jgi:hypothetical protein